MENETKKHMQEGLVGLALGTVQGSFDLPSRQPEVIKGVADIGIAVGNGAASALRNGSTIPGAAQAGVVAGVTSVAAPISAIASGLSSAGATIASGAAVAAPVVAPVVAVGAAGLGAYALYKHLTDS